MEIVGFIAYETKHSTPKRPNLYRPRSRPRSPRSPGHPGEGKDWREFEGRLNTHLKRLDALKVNYRRADGIPAVTKLVRRGE